MIVLGFKWGTCYCIPLKCKTVKHFSGITAVYFHCGVTYCSELYMVTKNCFQYFIFFVTSLKHFIHSSLQLCESQLSWLSLTTNEIKHFWTVLYVNIILKFHICKLLWQVHKEDGGSRFIWHLVKFLTSNIADLLYDVYKKCLKGMHNGVLSHAHFICRTVQFW